MAEPGTSMCPLPCVLVADCDDAWGDAAQGDLPCSLHFPSWVGTFKQIIFLQVKLIFLIK